MNTALASLPDGGALAYTVRGEGPALVLISGLGGLASFWSAFAEVCAPYFRVVTYDHRGVGRSSPLEGPTSITAMREDLIGLLDHLGIASAAILGHSTGGAIAQSLALSHPGRVSRLVLSATFARPCAYMRRLFAGRIELLDQLGIDAYRRHAVTLLNAPYWLDANDAIVDAELQAAAARSKPTDAAVVRERMLAVLGHDAQDQLAQIAASTRVVVAADDIVTPAYLSQRLADAIPQAELRLLPRGGHYAMRAEPALYREAVLDFLRDGLPAAETRT
ncbi:alpha/beta fold hydrolase [Bosea sp. WAO]|uniref:alpha/beta fold hydrolase n=1 Tax=Bosea sp. WAO TaxID=406341 RepID=UPI00082D905A|nr:alpha/beta fold hydrolase [Bosea sp. WAO]